MTKNQTIKPFHVYIEIIVLLNFCENKKSKYEKAYFVKKIKHDNT